MSLSKGPWYRSRRDAAPTKVGAVPDTASASDQACTCQWLAQASLWRNLPFGMGDRRVGTCMPCKDRPIRSVTTAHQMS
jgi:hypothetical protein